MRYAQIRKTDIANGTGIRVSVFVSGCTLDCPNCFNKKYQDFAFGEVWNPRVEAKFVELGKRPHIEGYSILGGEPLLQDDSLLHLVQRIKRETQKSIWLYTGFTFEEISDNPILQYIDVLVDGRYIEELKNPSLRFRGSSNQRIISIKESFASGKVVLWDEKL